MLLSRGMSDNQTTILDLRGLRCPQPVLRAKKALRGIPAGGTLVLECTDPLTVIDVPHFCNQTGHALSRHEKKGDLYIFAIVKTAKAAR
jgi:tRNA 2-thiouridine synthesizing protein A